MDTYDKNSLVAELDEIGRRYREQKSLAEQIRYLPYEKEKEKQNVIKPSAEKK